MNRTVSGLIQALLIVNILLLSNAADLKAQVGDSHPRIWLNSETRPALIERYNRNTTNAGRLRSWCDTNMSASLAGYVDSRALGMLKAVNYALMYQLTGNTAYSSRAVQIIEYGLDNPYTGYTADNWPGFDNFYTDRYLVPAAALVLDWCYNAMTSTQRTRFVAQLDYWANYIISSAPWAWQDASNNYYYGHAWALLTTGYAIYGHNANAQRYIDQARMMLTEGVKYTNGEEVAWAVSDNTTGRANGGMWNEGTSYGGVNYEFIFSLVLAVRSAEDPGAHPDFNFPEEAVLFHIYATNPGGDYILSEGDGAGTMTITDKIRVPVLFAIALSDGAEKNYGQYWVNHYSANTTSDYKLYNEFIWYDDGLQEINYDGILPDHYHTDGSQILIWREGWREDDCWISMRIGLLNTDHAHNGLGNFVIYENGALAPDKATETGQNELVSDIHHNVLNIQLSEDRKLYWGASVIEHFFNNSDYLYYAGDMSDPYLAQPDYRNNTVSHKEREFLLLKKEKTLVVMDRGTSYNAATDKAFQVYLKNAPTQSGGSYRTTNGVSDLLIRTAWPVGATFSTGTNGLPYLQVRVPGVVNSSSFLHLLKVAQAGGSLNASQVTSSRIGMVASAFQSGSDPVDYLVGFSNDPEGDPFTLNDVSFAFNRYSEVVKVYICNLPPNTTFYLAGTADGASASVTVSRSALGEGTSAMSDGEGVLFAPVSFGEDLLPPPVPGGVGIDRGDN